MPQSTNDKTEDLAPSGADRRDLLRKAGIGAAVAWTAPVILSATPAAAGFVSVCPACDGNNIVIPSDGVILAGWAPAEIESVAPPALGGEFVYRGASTSDANVAVDHFIQLDDCAGLIANGNVSIDVSVELGGQTAVSGQSDQARLIVNARPPGFSGATQLFNSGFQGGVPLTTVAANGLLLPSDTVTLQLRLTIRRRGGTPALPAPILGYADNISITLNCI